MSWSPQHPHFPVNFLPITLDNPPSRVLFYICSLDTRLLAIILDKHRIIPTCSCWGGVRNGNDTAEPTQTTDITRSG
jgi:hypothetical protein